MSRMQRAIGSSGFYHVVLRGISRQLLFEGTEEFRSFLGIINHYKEEYGFDVIAWCLMGNHAHLLIRIDGTALSEAVKRIALTFAMRHNKRNEHVGHVFQDRFHSVPIETNEQLLACVRYIHDNPHKAGICKAEEYRWSSYHEYCGYPGICDVDVVLDMLGGTEGFVEFSQAQAEGYGEPWLPRTISDRAARAVLERELTSDEKMALEHGTKKTRDASLRKLKALGLSVRQIERLTGVGRGIVQRA